MKGSTVSSLTDEVFRRLTGVKERSPFDKMVELVNRNRSIKYTG